MLKRTSHSDVSEAAPWPVPAMLAGVLLLVTAPWAPALIPNSVVWSDEDAQEYTRASADLHAKSYEAAAYDKSDHGHSHTGGTAEEKTAAKAAFDKIQFRRDNAGRWQSGMKYLLQAAGVAVCGAGIWGYIQNKRRHG